MVERENVLVCAQESTQVKGVVNNKNKLPFVSKTMLLCVCNSQQKIQVALSS